MGRFRAWGMNVALAYVFPNNFATEYQDAARKFVQSYLTHPPGDATHSLHVLVNGSPISEMELDLFDGVVPEFFQWNNLGKDIGAFHAFSRQCTADLLVCFGAHIRFWKAGWLDRITDQYLKTGPGLSGAWGGPAPTPHIRTTAFWFPPEILNSYHTITDNSNRYQFEHGERSIAAWAKELGFPRTVVTWSGIIEEPWNQAPSKDDILIRDQHTDAAGWK